MEFESTIVLYTLTWGASLLAIAGLIRYIAGALNAGSRDDD